MSRAFPYILVLLAGLLLWGGLIHSRTVNRSERSYEGKDSAYVVIYVASATCGICTKPSVMEAVSQIPALISRHDVPARYVFVSMDMLDGEGWKFAKRHGIWDEVSIGGRYYNEVLLSSFNDVEGITPGVPQVVIYKDEYSLDALNIPRLKQRVLIKSILGEKGIIRWVQQGCSLL